MQEEVPMDLSFEVLDLTLQCETLKSKAVVLSHDKSKSADKLKEVCLCLYEMAHEYAPELRYCMRVCRRCVLLQVHVRARDLLNASKDKILPLVRQQLS